MALRHELALKSVR